MAWCTRVDFAVSRNRDCLSKQVTARRLHWGFTEIHRVPVRRERCVFAHDLPKTLASRSTVTNRKLIESWPPFLFIYLFPFFLDLHLVSVARSEKSASWCIKARARVYYGYRWVTPLPAFFEYTPRIRYIFSRLRTIHQVNSLFRSLEIYRIVNLESDISWWVVMKYKFPIFN